MAISTSKNKAKTGINNVPSPKPEKKVKRDAINAVAPIKRNSIFDCMILYAQIYLY